jgi:hypothetical protein
MSSQRQGLLPKLTKYEPTFRVRIVDAEDDTVAEASKTLYVRRRAQPKG